MAHQGTSVAARSAARVGWGECNEPQQKRRHDENHIGCHLCGYAGDSFDGRFEIWMLVLNVGVRNAHPNLHDEV